MKKLFLGGIAAAVLLMSAAGVVEAQDVSFGLRGGLNIANFTGDDAEFVDEDDGREISPESLMGMAIGGYVNIPLSESFSIQPELIYSQKGAKYSYSYTYEDTVVSADIAWKLTYIDIPVLAKISFPSGDNTPYIYIGPSLGMNLSADYEWEVSGGGMTMSGSEDIQENTQDTETALVLGGGIQLASGLSADLRYTMGLSSIDNPDEGEDEADIKNTVISLLVGYSF